MNIEIKSNYSKNKLKLSKYFEMSDPYDNIHIFIIERVVNVTEYEWPHPV